MFAVLPFEIADNHSHALGKTLFDVEIGNVPVAHEVDHVEMANLFEHSPDEFGANSRSLVCREYAEMRNICTGDAVRDGGNPADDRSLRRNSQDDEIAALKNSQMRVRGGWIGPTHEVTFEIIRADPLKCILVSD